MQYCYRSLLSKVADINTSLGIIRAVLEAERSRGLRVGCRACISAKCSLNQRKDAKKGGRPVFCKCDCFSRSFPWERFSSVVLKNIENSCREEVSVGLSKLVTNELSSFAVGTLAGLVLAF